MKLDVLVIGPHPDDAELGAGGIILSLVARGQRVGILDLTRGEMGTRGNVDERRAEAEEAGKRLGVVVRRQAGLPDGGLANLQDQQRVLVPIIRELQPRVVLAPMHGDRHPDHEAAHFLVRDACYFSGLSRIAANAAPFRPEQVYFYSVYQDAVAPAGVFDISAVFEQKLHALRAYASQLHNPEYAGAQTYVASQAFWDSIADRARYWGSRIGVDYGEPVFADAPLKLVSLPGLEGTL